MAQKDFTLKIPDENRHIRLRFNPAKNSEHQLQQLIIIATGLYSHMDKKSQSRLAKSYQQAGFSTLQFNFMGHGEGENKSDGKIENITLSSSIKDIKTVWDYSKGLPNIDTEHSVISANSYGGLISLLALEKNLISPESMVLVAPFSLDKFKPWVLPLRLISKLMPDKVSQILKLPVPNNLLSDFLKHHTNGMTKKDMLGSTAVHFFIGSRDNVSSPKDIKKWCRIFNSQTPSRTPFVDNTQAHCTVYKDVPHFKIPESVQKDITDRSIDFIKKTREIRSI